MIQVLVLADDVTGALDTGVKFSSAGLTTKISLRSELSAGELEGDVLVLCLPTRHLPPEAAYEAVRRIGEAAAGFGIKYIFKKTDSALRGNVGAELSAVLDGSGASRLTFIPALPGMNRITKNGIHYIDGVPVSETVFGRDPFEPVKASYIPELLAGQCSAGTKILACAEPPAQEAGEKTLVVLDCTTREEMERGLHGVLQQCGRQLLAGCSGLAEALAKELAERLGREGRAQTVGSEKRFTVVCGSVNPISRSQLNYAGENGFERFHIPVERLLRSGGLASGEGGELLSALWEKYGTCDRLLIDTVQETPGDDAGGDTAFREMSCRVARLLGEILHELLDRSARSLWMIIGGDTLLGFMDAIGCRELRPAEELLPGVVASRFTYRGEEHTVISKSGGFGTEDVLLHLPIGTAAGK